MNFIIGVGIGAVAGLFVWVSLVMSLIEIEKTEDLDVLDD